jgi:hypothetical protein
MKNYNIEQLEQETSLILANNTVPEITKMEDYTKAGDVAKLLKKKIKTIDDKRKEYTLPFAKQVKVINADFKKLIEPLKEMADQIVSRQKQFYIEEKKRKDEEQAKLETEAVEAGEAEVAIVNDIKSSDGDFSSTTAVKKKIYKVLDITKVPQEFLTVDDKKIKEHMKHNFNNPPAGISYEYDITISHR